MAIYCVTLASGIGDVIQTLPFMYSLKKMGHQVLAVPASNVYSLDVCKMMYPAYHKLIPSDQIPRKSIFKGDLFSSDFNWEASRVPQWVAWYIWHGMQAPDLKDIETETDYIDVPWEYDIVLAPTCKPTWPMKMWNHWNELISLIPQRVAVVGLSGDGGHLYGDFEDFRGLLNIRQTAGLMKKAKVVVSLEGGMAHLACANGTKTVILYGGTSWIKNAPPRNGIIVKTDEYFPCQPCQFGKCFAGRNQMQEIVMYGCHKDVQVDGYSRCMNAISTKQVLKVLKDEIGL